MGLNKKALKLAGFKRCGLGAKHLFKSRQMLGHDQALPADSMVFVKSHLISLTKTSWKYGKFPRRPSLFRYEVGEANLLTGVMPKSANPSVKEIDADTNELTIEFTAIKSGYEPINREMAEGMPAGSFPSITPKPSALRSVLANMHVAAVATGMKKAWGKF